MTNLKATEHHLEVSADPRRLKIIAEAISEYMDKHLIEDTTLSDFRFDMEVEYQSHHGLDQDNWEFAETDIDS